MAVGVLTGARHDEAGMISGASATGHEIGGTLGIAIYASIATAASGGIFVGATAAAGIAHAFLIAATSPSAPASRPSSCCPPRRRSCPSCGSTPRRSPPIEDHPRAPAHHEPVPALRRASPLASRRSTGVLHSAGIVSSLESP